MPSLLLPACSSGDGGEDSSHEVEVVRDPVGEGLVTEDPGEVASACGFRPSGVDDGRAIVISIAAPGSLTPEEFDALAEDGIPLGGPGDEGYALERGVVFRSGDLVGITGESMHTDRALELAAIAAEGLPASC